MFEELNSKIKTESIRTNIILLVLILLFGVWLLYDFYSKKAVRGGEVVGRVIYKVNEVNRKLGSQALWEDMENNSEIYNFDTIRTDQFSKITVLLNDKSEVLLESNSMVFFNMEKDNLNVDFFQGKMEINSLNTAKGAKNLKIRAGSSEIKLDKGDLKLSKTSDSVVDIDVKDGKAEVKKGKDTIEVKKNEELKIRGNKLKQTKKRIRLLQPINSKYFLTQVDFQEIRFGWEGEEESYFLEIYNTSEKSIKVFSKEIQGYYYVDKLGPGKYKWQVSDSKKENTQSDNFYIVDDNPVSLFTPENGKNFFYTKVPPRILISWSRNQFIPYYKLEISKSQDFLTLEVDRITENESTVIDNLKKGTYYYRVLTKTGFLDSTYRISKVNSFVINERDTPNPPELLNPPRQHSFSEDEPLHFTWKSTENYSAYLFRISKNKDFKPLVEEVKTNSRSIELKKNLEEGEYFWSVQGILQDGKSKIASDIQTFTFNKEVKTIINLKEPGNYLETRDTAVPLVWTSEPKKKNYTIEISKEPEFSKIWKRISSQKTSFILNSLEPGVYYWRVKTQRTTSQVNVFSILKNPIPAVVFPKNNNRVDLSDKDQLKFKWEYVDEAVSYNLELIELQTNKRILKKRNLKKNEFLLDDITIFKTGAYLLKVKAVFGKERGSFSEAGTSKFEIFLSKKIQEDEIKFITPQDVYIE